MQSSVVKFQKTEVLPLSFEPCITQHKRAFPLTIKTMTGKLLEVWADPADPINILKVQIKEKENIEIYLQKLVFAGKTLENKKTVGSYDLKENAIIYLKKRDLASEEEEEDEDEEKKVEEDDGDDDQIQVQIIYEKKPVFEINVNRKDSIADVRAKIMQNIEADDDFEIKYKRNKVDNSKKVADYNYFKDQKLTISGDISLNIEPGFKVNVLCQQVPYQVDVKPTMLLKDFRSSVSSLVKYRFILLWNGKILSDDNASLGSCGIRKTEDIIVMPESTGGNCIKLMLAIEGVETDGVEQLRESLNFLEDQQSLNEIFAEGLESIKSIKSYSKYKPEELLAVRLWTSNIMYKQLNNCLVNNQDLSQWRIYLKNLMKGLKHMNYFKGKAYRGTVGPQNFENYKKGAKISWNSISGLTKSKKEAEETAGNNGTLYEIDVISARDISRLSLSPSEKLMLLPYSCFEVMDIINNPDQPLLVKLREIPIPRAPKVLFWVDDEPENNHDIAKSVEERGISVVFCTSTKDALDVIENYKWLLDLNNLNFRVVSDMTRYEDGKPNYTAGIDLLKALFNDYNYQFHVMVFCGDVQKAKENAEKAELKGKYEIANQDEELAKFVDF